MTDPHADPRTGDTLVYEILRTAQGAAAPEVIGRATFRGGRTGVEAPDDVRIAIEELLGRSFVDRVQADERPRGYRRTGRGAVERLVVGMPEHFIARMRGLWLSYPDGSVVTARALEEATTSTVVVVSEPADLGPPITDPRIRRATLAVAEERVNAAPLVRSHAPDTGLRPFGPVGSGPVSRTDCGWIA